MRTGGQLQMNRLSSSNNRMKFKTSGNVPIILEEFIEYTSLVGGTGDGCWPLASPSPQYLKPTVGVVWGGA